MILLGLGVLGCLILLALLGQRNEDATRERWEAALDGTGPTFTEVSQRIHDERDMVEHSFQVAETARDDGKAAEASRFLRLGASMAESCSETLPGLLKNLSVLSRQADSIAPVERLEMSSFTLKRLRTLMAIQGIVHSLLVTSRERLQLRLRVLRYSVPAVTRWLIRAAYSTADAPAIERRWRELGDVRADMEALTDESLESLRIVLQSLAATARAHRAPAQGR